MNWFKNEKEIEKQYQTEVQEKKLLACIEDHRYEEADWTFAQAQGLITNVDMTYIREHLDIIKNSSKRVILCKTQFKIY